MSDNFDASHLYANRLRKMKEDGTLDKLRQMTPEDWDDVRKMAQERAKYYLDRLSQGLPMREEEQPLPEREDEGWETPQNKDLFGENEE